VSSSQTLYAMAGTNWGLATQLSGVGVYTITVVFAATPTFSPLPDL